MSKGQLKIHRTDIGNLVSNLRGEVGEIITSWVLYHDLAVRMRTYPHTTTQELLDNPQFNRDDIQAEKLLDDMVARLSELAKDKIGTLTFHFVSKKLGILAKDTREFKSFIVNNGLTKKRNHDISHKVLPEQWSDHKYLHIQPRIILKGVARALRLMKKIDIVHLGPSSPYLWQEARKKRHSPMAPPKVGYMILPYFRLSNMQRVTVALEEIKLGMSKWEDLPTEINGKPSILKANKKWGVVIMGRGQFLVTPEYPLIEINSLTTQ